MTEKQLNEPNPNREVESGATGGSVDIKNLRFYADLFKEHQWQTDILHWTVFEATLKEIAERYAALQSELSALKGENERLKKELAEVRKYHDSY